MSTPDHVAGTDRDAAIVEVRRLIAEHQLTESEIAGDNHIVPPADGLQRSALLVKVLSYVGGAFVFSGIAAFVALQWESMNSFSRVVISLGSGLALFVLGLLALNDRRFVQAATPLLLAAAALEPLGMLVALHEFGGGGDEQVAALVTAGTVGVQYLLAFAQFRRTTMLLVVVLFASAFWGLLLDLWDVDESLIALTSGLAWLLLGLQLHRKRHDAITPPLFFFGCWAFLFGLFDLVQGSFLELVFLAGAIGTSYLGVWARSRALNFASTIAILAYTAYFTGEYFADSIGWPIALIVIGLLMIGISAVAWRIDQRYIRQP